MQLKKKFSFIVIIFLCSLGFHNCSRSGVLTKDDLAGYWVLQAINGEPAQQYFEGSLPTLVFDFDLRTISGTSACNRYKATFSNDKSVFVVSNLDVTEMLCTDKNSETEYIRLLTQSGSFLGMKGDLLLIIQEEKNILVFEKHVSEIEDKIE
ncbi:MAG: hypothetical protein RL662_2203 [Bacteroidota bacterium]